MTSTRHIVWDWNGTLLDDLEIVIESVNVGITALGVSELDETSYRDHFTRPVRSFYDSILGRQVDDMEWEYLDKTFHDEYFRRVHLAPMTVDALDAVDRVARHGWGQSILSMTTHDKLVEIVTSRGIVDRFLLIDGLRDATGGLKAEHLVRHLAALRVDPERVVVIGDTPDDVAAARSVGAGVVVYDGGSHHLETLRETSAPIAHTLIEALDMVS